MSLKKSANWYESHLPPDERKTRGHFSTPPALIEQILDACGYSPDNLDALLYPHHPHVADGAAIRVLDPACGSGNFLSAVAGRLATYAKRAQMSEAQVCTLLQNSLWGFDPDPVACFLAELQVRTRLETHKLFPDQLHIHQADGLAFPWQEQHECVDLFLANPPYLAAKNTDLSVYRSTEGRGQSDSYLLFLDLALRVVRPGGWLGLVLPDAVLARTNATRERKRLLEETTIHALWHLSGLFPAYVGAVVLVAQKNPPPLQHVISWRREKWYVSEKRRLAMIHIPSSVPQSLLCAQSGGELRYLLGDAQHLLISRLQVHLDSHLDSLKETREQPLITPLKTLVTIKRGEELSKDSNLVAEAALTSEHLPLLRGGVDVNAYATPHTCNWLPRPAIVKPLQRYLVPKLLIVKSTSHLQATLDMGGHVVLQTLYMLHVRPLNTATREKSSNTIRVIYQTPSDEYSMNTEKEELDLLYFLLALLNSDLLRSYVYVLHTAYKWVQPQIEQHVLERLPIPTINMPQYEEIVQRAKEIMAACDGDVSVVELSDHIKQLHTEQERTIVAMYQDALDRFVNEGVD